MISFLYHYLFLLSWERSGSAAYSNQFEQNKSRSVDPCGNEKLNEAILTRSQIADTNSNFMKKLLILIALMLLGNNGFAQDKLYLILEFMKVDNEQEAAYMETEAFWQKIQEQRVKNGDILGWDLWSLQPGGEDQGYQYLTVTLYNDPLKMMS
ncbi:hypothetical protein LX77_01665, partial [Gelidibacter algens]